MIMNALKKAVAKMLGEKRKNITFNIIEPVKNRPKEFNVTVVNTSYLYDKNYSTASAVDYYLYIPLKGKNKNGKKTKTVCR